MPWGAPSKGRAASARRIGAAIGLLVVVLAGVRSAPEARAAGAVLTFTATADGAVDASAPGAPFVDLKELPVDADPARASYVRFVVAGATAPVERAVLRLHVRDKAWAPSPIGGVVARAGSGTWTESSLSWTSRPGAGPAVASIGAVARNTWVDVEVTSLVTGDGPLDLAITSPGTDGAAYDAREAGALAPQLVVTLAEVTPPATTTVTLTPTADASVNASTPTTATGTSTRLAVGAAPDRATYLRFDLTGLAGRVVGAQLRLHVADDDAAASTTSGGRFALVSPTPWTEAALTWANRPPIDGAGLWNLGAVGRNTWVAMDVGWAVRPGSTLEVAATSTSADNAAYDSRETSRAPQLVVTIERGAAAPVTVFAAGDIARCNAPFDEQTASLLGTSSAPVLALGDLAYPGGNATDIADCYGPSWGPVKARTRPVVGNHEYNSAGAAPYWSYFGAAAGTAGQGWYSFDIGSWHVVGLNSNCWYVGCGAGSAQLAWLQADLAATTKPCIAAMWHHPRFTSSAGGASTPAVAPLWDALDAAGADLVLSGHAHSYERFAPQTSAGVAVGSGIRQFVVGTGGAELYENAPTPAANSRFQDARHYGVMRLELGSGSYSWAFKATTGETIDPGSAACR